MTLPATCQGCGEPVRLENGANGLTASACACVRRREGNGRPSGPPAAKPRQKRAQRVERPFRPRAAISPRWLKLWLPRGFRAAEGPNGRAWQARHRAAHEWRELVAAALATLEKRPAWPWPRVSVLYVAYGRREMDRDNIVGCGKPILDALVRNGIVPDDSAEHVPAPPNARWRECPLWMGGEFVVVEVRAERPGKEAT